MQTKTKLLSAVVCAALLTACATNATGIFKDFKVNGQTVSAQYQQGLYDDLIASGQKESDQLKAAIKEVAIEQFAIRQEAEKTEIATNPAVMRRIENAKIQILTQALVADYLKKSPIQEQQVAAAYHQEQRAYGPSEYHVFQIFVDNESDANALKAQLLKKPGTFAELAKTKNDSKQLADRSGDMGWISPSTIKVPELKNAIIQTKVGTNADMVKTQAGWHFVRVEAIRPAQLFPSYEQAKASIANQLAQQKAKAYIAGIIKKAQIE